MEFNVDKIKQLTKKREDLKKELINEIRSTLTGVLKTISYLEGIKFSVESQYNDEGYTNRINQIELKVKKEPLHPELVETRFKELQEYYKDNIEKRNWDNDYYTKKLNESIKIKPEYHYEEILNAKADIDRDGWLSYYDDDLDEILYGLLIEESDLKIIDNLNDLFNNTRDDILPHFDLEEGEKVSITVMKEDEGEKHV